MADRGAVGHQAVGSVAASGQAGAMDRVFGTAVIFESSDVLAVDIPTVAAGDMPAFAAGEVHRTGRNRIHAQVSASGLPAGRRGMVVRDDTHAVLVRGDSINGNLDLVWHGYDGPVTVLVTDPTEKDKVFDSVTPVA